MAKVYKYGQMVQNMRVIGTIIWLMVKASSGMLMVMSTKESGKTIKSMASVSITI